MFNLKDQAQVHLQRACKILRSFHLKEKFNVTTDEVGLKITLYNVQCWLLLNNQLVFSWLLYLEITVGLFMYHNLKSSSLRSLLYTSLQWSEGIYASPSLPLQPLWPTGSVRICVTFLGVWPSNLLTFSLHFVWVWTFKILDSFRCCRIQQHFLGR